MNLKKYLRRFVRKYIFGQMSSGQKDGGLSAAVMCSAVMCPAAKWVDTVYSFMIVCVCVCPAGCVQQLC